MSNRLIHLRSYLNKLNNKLNNFILSSYNKIKIFMVFSEVFWVGLYTAGGALILAIMNICYKSKCKEVDICCIRIVRDVVVEEEIDQSSLPTKTRL